MNNPYARLFRQPAEDKREPVEALRQFAEALQQYTGQDTNVEVNVSVHPEDGTDQLAQVQMSVYVPKTDYVNILLTAHCKGVDGFPIKIDPYFASATFQNGIETCQNRKELDAALERFAQSREVLSLLDYMKHHAQKKKT